MLKNAHETLSTNQYPKHEQFEKDLYNITKQNIEKEPIVKLWLFESAVTGEKFFFIKNDLFTSNCKEKIRGSFIGSNELRFVDEIDTDIETGNKEGLSEQEKNAAKYNCFLECYRKKNEWEAQYGKKLPF